MSDKLPVLVTVRGAYRLTMEQIGALLRGYWPWLVAAVVLMGGLDWFLVWPNEKAPGAATGGFGGTMLSALVEMMVGVVLAVAWHRLVLLREPVPANGSVTHRREVGRYAAWSVAFMLLTAVPALVAVGVIGAAIPGAELEETAASTAASDATTGVCCFCILLGVVIGLPLVAALLYLPTRLSLILPAMALGRDDITTSDVWRSTRGNFWRLFIGSCLTIAPGLISFGVLWAAGLISLTPSRLGSLAESVVSALISLVVGMIWVTFLSLAYRHWFGDAVSQSAAPVE